MMHVPTERPACWTDTVPERAITPFWDGGRSCGVWRHAEDEITAVTLLPTCDGCARLQRARDLRAAIT